MHALLNLGAARAVQRVLRDYPHARARLAAHAGKRADFKFGPLAIALRVTRDGGVEPVGAGANDAPAVEFELPPDAMPALWGERAAALRKARFSGDGEFAQLIGELAGGLQWDVEEDLSRWVGDIAAHRLVGGARGAWAWQAEARARLADNLAEYLTEELGAFARAADLEALALANETLRYDLARLDARLALLDAGARPPAGPHPVSRHADPP